jgi:hypothetical protein
MGDVEAQEAAGHEARYYQQLERGGTSMTIAARDRVRGVRAPSLNAVLYRHGVWVFSLMAAAMFVAFWPSYFSRLTAQPDWRVHAHGIALTMWVALLVTQAWLIRTGHRSWHRLVGKLSYVVVALVIVSTTLFLHSRLQAAPPGVERMFFATLVLGALVAFAVLFGLAIYHRRTPTIHARYMLATIVPFVSAITDRLLSRYLPVTRGWAPHIGTAVVMPALWFVVADLTLVGLAVWDWRANRRLVFPVVLLVALAYHAMVLTSHRWAAWETFTAWFVSLPLS